MGKALTKEEREEKKRLFLEAMEDSMGLITTSCKRAGISRVTLEKWRKTDKELDDAINNIKDRAKEFVEGQLMTAIRNGNVASIMFYLKTQCGYRETQKLEVTETSQIDVAAALREMKEQLDKKTEDND